MVHNWPSTALVAEDGVNLYMYYNDSYNNNTKNAYLRSLEATGSKLYFNYNANANYGLFYFNANNAASNTNANLGSRNLFELWKITNCADSSMALAKNIAVKAELSRGLEKL